MYASRSNEIEVLTLKKDGSLICCRMSAKSGRRKSGYVPYSRGNGTVKRKASIYSVTHSLATELKISLPLDLIIRSIFPLFVHYDDEVLLQHNDMAAPSPTVRDGLRRVKLTQIDAGADKNHAS